MNVHVNLACETRGAAASHYRPRRPDVVRRPGVQSPRRAWGEDSSPTVTDPSDIQARGTVVDTGGQPIGGRA